MRPLEVEKWEEVGKIWAWFGSAVFEINFFNF